MPGASLPNTDSLVTWSDNVDNWRSADADFLQKRTVLRFSSTTTRNTIVGPSTAVPVPAEGQVTYVSNGGIDGKGGLEYVDNTFSWRPLLSVKNLGVSDTSGSFGMRLSSDSAPSVALEIERVVLGINRILSVEASKLVFKTGAATAELSTNVDSIVSNLKITVPSASLGTATASSLAASGAVSGASVAASGALTGNTLVAGSSTLGATGVTTLTASSSITGVTVYGTTSVRGGSVLVSDTKVSNNSAVNQSLNLSATATTLSGDSVVLAPTSPTSAVRYRTSSGAPFALVIVSATDPGLSNYPDGTLWIQP